MKLLEVPTAMVAQYCNLDPLTEADAELLESVVIPAARARMEAYTGTTIEDLNAHEELSIAYLALCSFLYDNRSLTIDNDKQNAVIASFLDAHCRNLVSG